MGIINGNVRNDYRTPTHNTNASYYQRFIINKENIHKAEPADNQTIEKKQIE